MKPKLRIATYKYWACHDKDHRHKTEDTAARCIEKAGKETKQYNSWGGEDGWKNLEKLLSQRESGLTLAAIGKIWGVSDGRAGQLVDKARRVQRRRAAYATQT